jgi:hypothetical protein
MKLQDSQIEIQPTQYTDHKIVLVTVRGRVYAATFAPMDEPLTIEYIKRLWVEDRKAFRPYDTSSARYLA